MSDEDFIEIIVHGRHCPVFEEPRTISDWQALALIEGETIDGHTTWKCPVCEQIVYEMWDGGEIEFGT